jgi:hypothetical protein
MKLFATKNALMIKRIMIISFLLDDIFNEYY